jgi:hypothetical protein
VWVRSNPVLTARRAAAALLVASAPLLSLVVGCEVEAYTEIYDCSISVTTASACPSLEDSEAGYQKTQHPCDQENKGSFSDGPFPGHSDSTDQRTCCYVRRKPPESELCVGSVREAPFFSPQGHGP